MQGGSDYYGALAAVETLPRLPDGQPIEGRSSRKSKRLTT